MTTKFLTSFFMLLMVLLCISSVSVILADVPSVLELTKEKESDLSITSLYREPRTEDHWHPSRAGTRTVLVMEIRHNSPSSNHYVDVIEVEIDGKISEITDLEPQIAARFEERYTLPESATKIQVRAHCNLHGWSPWISEENEESSGGGDIPGFPSESIILGLLLSSFLIWYLQKRK